MNNLKVSLVMLAMALVSSQIISQTTGKIGAGFTSDPLNVLTLDYSRVKDSGKAINFRLSYGEESFFSDFSRQIVLSDNPDENPYLSEKNLGRYTNRIKLAVGPEFPISETKFSWGIEGLVGVGFYDETLAEQRFLIDENGIIDEGLGYAPLPENYNILESVDRVLFSPGIQARFSFNTQFSKKLGLQLFASSSIEHDFQIKSRFTSANPENELNTEEISITNLNLRLGATFFLLKN